MNNLLEQLKLWWESATTSTRIMGVGLALVLVASLSVALTIAAAPSYQDLFTNLTPQDAAAIAQKLDDAHEKYQMTDSDGTIRVPAQDKDRLRMDMIRAGLPSKSSSLLGTEWLDKIGMSTTSDLQNQYIRMANEGELSQTIGSLSEVASAAVHISPGNNSPMLDTITPASASVVVNLKAGETLTSDQIMGIANLVAKSVPSLDIKNVVVMDGAGTQLWDGGQNPNGPGGGGSSKLLAEQQYSESMRKQMQSYLDMVLGPHTALVSVTSELNYNEVHSVDTKFSKGPVTSNAETSETYSGGAGGPGAGIGGVSGTTANTPAPGGSAPNAGNTGGGRYDKSDTAQNYQPGKTETETTVAPGGVERLAIAVLVDQKVPASSIASITNYLTTLAGVTPGDTTRTVTVQPIPFSTTQASAQQAQTNAAAAAEKMDLMMKLGAVVLALGAILFIFMKSTGGHRLPQTALLAGSGAPGGMRNFEIPVRSEGLLEDSPLSIDDVLAEMPDVQRRKRPASAPMDIDPIEEQHDVKLESIRDMVRSHPQSVTLLLKGWIAEDGGGM